MQNPKWALNPIGKNLDTKILDINVDIRNFETWFDGRQFELERLYRATVDGFNSNGFRQKVHMKENIIVVAESEHGRKFGGYTSLAINQNNGDSWH